MGHGWWLRDLEFEILLSPNLFFWRFFQSAHSEKEGRKFTFSYAASISYYRHRPWATTVHETNQYLKKEQQILGYRSLLWYLKIWASSQYFLCRSLRLETRKTQARTRSSWKRARLWWNLKRWSHDSAFMDFGKALRWNIIKAKQIVNSNAAIENIRSDVAAGLVVNGLKYLCLSI